MSAHSCTWGILNEVMQVKVRHDGCPEHFRYAAGSP